MKELFCITALEAVASSPSHHHHHHHPQDLPRREKTVCLRLAMLCLLLGIASCFHVHAAELLGWGAAKGEEYLTMDAGGQLFTVLQQAAFRAWVVSPGTNPILGAAIRPAGGALTTLEVNVEGNMAYVGSGVADTNQLDVTYPNGGYELSVRTSLGGQRSIPVNLPATPYPPIPEWLEVATLSTLDASRDQTVRWKAMAGASASRWIQVRVTDLVGKELWSTPGPEMSGALPGTATSVIVPATAWKPPEPGFPQTYQLELAFYQAASVDTTSVAGARGVGGFFRSSGIFINPQPAIPEGPVSFYGLARGQILVQTNQVLGAPTMVSGFQARAWARPLESGSLSGATISKPGGGSATLTQASVDEDYLLDAGYSSDGAARIAFPAGVYTMRFLSGAEAASASLPLSGSAYPVGLKVTDEDGVRNIVASKDYDLSWSSSNAAAADGAIQVSVFDAAGEPVFETPFVGAADALSLAVTNVVIPAGSLLGGQTYEARLRVALWDGVELEAIPGARGVSGLFTETRLVIRTTVEIPDGFPAHVTIANGSNLPPARVGMKSELRLWAHSGHGAQSWSVVGGSLPAGLSLNVRHGDLEGYPQTAGQFSFRVKVMDAAGDKDEADFVLPVTGSATRPSIVTASLPVGVPDEYYSAFLEASGGVPPYRWTLQPGGVLPEGLALDGVNGLVSGDPMSGGTTPLVFRVTDALGQWAERSLTLVLSAPLGWRACVIDGISLASDGGLNLLVSGDPIRAYTVETSPDLVRWDDLLTTNLHAGDPIRCAMNGARRFYRLRQEGEIEPVNPLIIQPVTDPSREVSALVGTNGGVLRLTNAVGVKFTLDLPAHALTEPVLVRMTAVQSIGGLPAGSALAGAVELGPDDTELEVPALLTIESPTPLGTDTSAFGAMASGAGFHLAPGNLAGNSISVLLDHFSPHGAVTAPASTSQGHRPCSIEAEFQDRLADYAKRPYSARNFAGFVQIHRQWFQAVVQRKLVPALRSDDLAYPALREFDHWHWAVGNGDALAQRLFGEGLPALWFQLRAETDTGRAKAKSVLMNAIFRARDRCIQQENPLEGIKILAYRTLGVQLESNGSMDPMDRTRIEIAIRDCLRFEFSYSGFSGMAKKHQDHMDSSTVAVSTHTRGELTYILERRQWEEIEEHRPFVHATVDGFRVAPHGVDMVANPGQLTRVPYAWFFAERKPSQKTDAGGCVTYEFLVEPSAPSLVVFPRGGFDVLTEQGNLADAFWTIPFLALFQPEEDRWAGGNIIDGWRFTSGWTVEGGSHYASLYVGRNKVLSDGYLTGSASMEIYFVPNRH